MKPPPRNPFAPDPDQSKGSSGAPLRSPLLDTVSKAAAKEKQPVSLKKTSSNPFGGSSNPFGEEPHESSEGSSRLNPFGKDPDAPPSPRQPPPPPPRLPEAVAVAMPMPVPSAPAAPVPPALPVGVVPRGPSILKPPKAVPSSSSSGPAPAAGPVDGDDDDGDGDAMDDRFNSPTRHSDVIPRQSQSKTMHLQEAALHSVAVMVDKSVLSSNAIYYKNTLSGRWLILAVVAHVIQWGIMLDVSRPLMSSSSFAFVIVLVIAVIFLLIGSRVFTAKKPRVNLRTREQLTPDDEADSVKPLAVHMLAVAALCEGVAYAVFTSETAGKMGGLAAEGYRSFSTIIETLQFASITFLTFHRSIRPSNRCDPLRTMLELEVVSVCWDALDGSTIFMLLSQRGLSGPVTIALKVLQAFWYISVGARTAYMYCIHLPPSSPVYQFFITRPLELAASPTVDRTLQSLRQRSVVTLVMSAAELYAMCIRIYLWSKGQLDVLQIEMAIKNCLFLFQIYSAADMYFVTNRRDWNSRDLGFGLQYPSREWQLNFFRLFFVASYLIEGCLLSVICAHVTQESFNWIGNFVVDVILAAFFYYYGHSCHIKLAHERQSWYKPQFSFVIFPVKMVLVLSCVMAANLFIARIPTIYAGANSMAAQDSGLLWTYANALLVVMFSVATIGAGAMYWYLSHMLFHKEFTASPGNYNAIHDPTISMVAMATQIEGALDVLSCVTLMQVAPLHLPSAVNGAVQFFCLFELFNACQSFALQVLLSGGQDDTPLDLVKWKAWLRGLRGLIDLGTFVLRLVLWVQYNALSSVFLIKNLYNLLHTYAQIERYVGVTKYPKYTLFTESVPPNEWYGLTRQEWRDATRSTVIQQAQAGRAV